MSEPVNSPAFSITVTPVYTGIISSIADLQNMPAQSDGLVWGYTPNSKLASVEKTAQDWIDDGYTQADYDTYQYILGFSGITKGWSGACYDPTGNRILLTGGGHNAYGGNEVFSFDLQSMAWDRILDPTPGTLVAANKAEYLDGNPCARHTYYFMCVDPARNLLVLPTGNTWNYQQLDANEKDSFFYYPLSSLTGDRMTDKQAWVRRSSAETDGTVDWVESWATVDPRTGYLLYAGSGNKLRAMNNPSSGQWLRCDNSNTGQDYTAGICLMSSRNEIWSTGRADTAGPGGNPKLSMKKIDVSDYELNMNNVTGAWYDLTGDELRNPAADEPAIPVWQNLPFPTMFEDTEHGRCVFWRAFLSDFNYQGADPGTVAKEQSSRDFWIIDPDTMVSTKYGSSALAESLGIHPPPIPQSGATGNPGLYTRIGFIPSLNVGYFIRSAFDDIYFFKLPPP